MTLLTELYPEIGVEKFCTVFGKTRQAWYYSKTRGEQQDMRDSLVVAMVREIREDHPRIGTRKLYHLLEARLKQHGIKAGRDKLFEILHRYGMLIRYRKRRAITTNSNHPFYKYDNLIQGLKLTASNQLWVSDITYLQLRGCFAYLSLITDAFSRKIIGYALWPTLAAEGPINALEMALETISKRKMLEDLIHHSDRGVQYCCNDYVTRLKVAGISISMSYNGDPYQNAIAERINGILKMEYGLSKTSDSIEKAKEAVISGVEKYNQRPHDSLNYLTPNQAHHLEGMIKRNWKNYRACVTNQDKQST